VGVEFGTGDWLGDGAGIGGGEGPGLWRKPLGRRKRGLGARP